MGGSKSSRFKKKGKIQIPNKQNNHPQETTYTQSSSKPLQKIPGWFYTLALVTIS